jgi:hypothetical protein
MRTLLLAVLALSFGCSREKQFVQLCEADNASLASETDAQACTKCLEQTGASKMDSTYLLLGETCPNHYAECKHGGTYTDCACFARAAANDTDNCQKHLIDVYKRLEPCMSACTKTP